MGTTNNDKATPMSFKEFINTRPQDIVVEAITTNRSLMGRQDLIYRFCLDVAHAYICNNSDGNLIDDPELSREMAEGAIEIGGYEAVVDEFGSKEYDWGEFKNNFRLLRGIRSWKSLVSLGIVESCDIENILGASKTSAFKSVEEVKEKETDVVLVGDWVVFDEKLDVVDLEDEWDADGAWSKEVVTNRLIKQWQDMIGGSDDED